MQLLLNNLLSSVVSMASKLISVNDNNIIVVIVINILLQYQLYLQEVQGFSQHLQITAVEI